MRNKRVNEDYDEDDALVREKAKAVDKALWNAKNKILDLAKFFASQQADGFDDIDEYWMDLVAKVDKIQQVCSKSVKNYFNVDKNF